MALLMFWLACAAEGVARPKDGLLGAWRLADDSRLPEQRAAGDPLWFDARGHIVPPGLGICAGDVPGWTQGLLFLPDGRTVQWFDLDVVCDTEPSPPPVRLKWRYGRVAEKDDDTWAVARDRGVVVDWDAPKTWTWALERRGGGLDVTATAEDRSVEFRLLPVEDDVPTWPERDGQLPEGG